MLFRYDAGIIITERDGAWYFGPKPCYGMSVSVQTNLRHGRRSGQFDPSFFIEQPQKGCVVLLGIWPFFNNPTSRPRGPLGYAAYVFEDAGWRVLTLKKWIDIGPEKRTTIREEYAEPKLGLRIGELYLNPSVEIVLDFWAGWLGISDVIRFHSVRGTQVITEDALSVV